MRAISSLEFHKFCNSDGTTEVFRKKERPSNDSRYRKEERLISLVSALPSNKMHLFLRRVVPPLQRWHWSPRCEADGNASRVNELRISVSFEVRVAIVRTVFSFFFLRFWTDFCHFFFFFNINHIAYKCIFICMDVRVCRDIRY